MSFPTATTGPRSICGLDIPAATAQCVISELESKLTDLSTALAARVPRADDAPQDFFPFSERETANV